MVKINTNNTKIWQGYGTTRTVVNLWYAYDKINTFGKGFMKLNLLWHGNSTSWYLPRKMKLSVHIRLVEESSSSFIRNSPTWLFGNKPLVSEWMS